MPWKRPATVPLGQVWMRFKGREIDGKPARQYQIRDLEEEYKEQCIELMRETFLRDEPLCKLLDFKTDPISVEEAVSHWREWLQQDISLACFTEEDGEPDQLVAFNVLYVKTRDDEEDGEEIVGEKYAKIIRTLDAAERLVDVFQHYGVEEYLTSSGVTVLPGHRGQNIAAKMFEAREPLCKAINIRATCTVFTATASQMLAKKCGYELLATLPYSDMLSQGIDLAGCETEIAQIRGAKFDF